MREVLRANRATSVSLLKLHRVEWYLGCTRIAKLLPLVASIIPRGSLPWNRLGNLVVVPRGSQVLSPLASPQCSPQSSHRRNRLGNLVVVLRGSQVLSPRASRQCSPQSSRQGNHHLGPLASHLASHLQGRLASPQCSPLVSLQASPQCNRRDNQLVNPLGSLRANQAGNLQENHLVSRLDNQLEFRLTIYIKDLPSQHRLFSLDQHLRHFQLRAHPSARPFDQHGNQLVLAKLLKEMSPCRF